MKTLLAITFLMLSINSHATESSKHEKLVELINVMNMDAIVDSMHIQMEQMMQNMPAQMGVQESEQAIFDKHYKKMLKLIRESITWKKMEPLTIEIYEKNFSEKEISDMLAFYKTDTGKALIAKMPAVMQESSQLGQALLQETLPKIQKITQELGSELQESRSQQK